MSLRKMVYQKAIGLADFIAVVPVDRLFSAGAAGMKNPGDSPSRPFAVVRFQPDNPGLVPKLPASQQRFSIWIHDEPGSMDNIEDAVAALRDGLPSALPGLLEGTRVMECVWEGTSADGYDDHFGTTTVYVDFMATYKPSN